MLVLTSDIIRILQDAQMSSMIIRGGRSQTQSQIYFKILRKIAKVELYLGAGGPVL